MPNTFITTQTPFMNGTQLSVGTTASTDYTILNTDTVARRVYAISVTSTDAGAQTVNFSLNDGTTTFQLFTLSIPANSGNSTTIAAVDLFGDTKGAPLLQKQRDSNGVPYINVPSTWKLHFKYGTALTGTEVLNVLVLGEKY